MVGLKPPFLSMHSKKILVLCRSDITQTIEGYHMYLKEFSPETIKEVFGWEEWESEIRIGMVTFISTVWLEGVPFQFRF